MIIDFHTHYFPDNVAPKVLPKLAGKSCTMPFTDGTLGGLIRSMQKSGVTHSVTLPVATTMEQTGSINDKIIACMEDLTQNGIIPFGGMHPDFADYKRELKRLKDAGVKGIKIHPAYQNVDFDDIRYKRILSAANELDMIVLTHAGIDIGIYHHNFTSVRQIENVLNDVAPARLILAHMGNWGLWEEFEANLAGAPLLLDTAFSIGPIIPYPGAASHEYSTCTLADEDFLRISHKHGMDKILFATDSPWQDQTAYLERFKSIGLSEKEQAQLFFENAKNLLSL